MLFETLPLEGQDVLGSGAVAALVGMFVALIIVWFVVSIAIYIYMSFAYMKIGKKAKLASPGLAWIPGVGPLIIAFQSSKMHWWPWLLIIGFFIPFVNILFVLAFLVYVIIWEWKMFEVINKPGWWAILLLIPIVNLIMIGIAAWSKD